MLVAVSHSEVQYGRSIGASGIAVGSAIFNTSITGYQEATTDPSYSDQILLFTFPHIGNSGTNPDDMESKKIQTAGIITKILTATSSGVRLVSSFIRHCQKGAALVVTGVDTRKLTATIRKKSDLRVCIVTDTNQEALTAEIVVASPSDVNANNPTWRVSAARPVSWFSKGSYGRMNRLKVLVFDYGTKLSILRNIVKRGCELVAVNSHTQHQKVGGLRVLGVVLSNGPGNPRSIGNLIVNTKEQLHHNVPTLGICLGHQVLSLALGAKVRQLVPGHHGTNHPVKELRSRKVLVTSQNHNFSSDLAGAVDGLEVTHLSLFDGSVQGIDSYRHPVSGFQGHPEACPGPRDAEHLFDSFTQVMLHSQE